MITAVSAGRLGACGPREMKVAGAGVAALIEADLVEPGELVVITGHHCQVLDDADLVGRDLGIGASPMNSNGQIVGCAATGGAFVYSNGTITNPGTSSRTRSTTTARSSPTAPTPPPARLRCS